MIVCDEMIVCGDMMVSDDTCNLLAVVAEITIAAASCALTS